MISFPAFAFRQAQNAPITVSFIASSASIDDWAKVPTRLSNQPHRFQRASIPTHVEEVRKFFIEDTTKKNSSPTAILVGVEPDKIGKIRLVDDKGQHIPEGSITAKPVSCTVQIDFEVWDSSVFDTDHDKEISALFEKVKSLYESSAAEDADADADAEVDDDDDVADDGTDADEESSSNTASSNEDEDEGDDEKEDEPENDWLSSIDRKKLVEICESKLYVGWKESLKRDLISLFKDDLKPCVIIDGQHRVKGTREIGDIPFVVSMLPNADWGELAFQFIVNNSSAKKVDDNLLFGIVGESLTAAQLEATEARLNRSGIKVSLIKAAMLVQLEPNPFTGMLRTNTPGEKGFLDATAMQKKVIEPWFGSRGKNGTRPTFKSFQAHEETKKWSMGELFIGVCKGTNAADRAKDWQDGKWFKYFDAFWRAVSKHFDDRLWPASQDQWLPRNTPPQSMNPEMRERQKLMRATVLGLLQKALLQAWADFQSQKLSLEEKTFSDLKLTPEKFEKDITGLVKNMTSDFFTELQYTGFDASKELRTDMTKQMLFIIQKTKKFADLRAGHRFWNASAN